MIVSRTLAYAIVTGLLVGISAALFSLLRSRVQQLVDRRFNRRDAAFIPHLEKHPLIPQVTDMVLYTG